MINGELEKSRGSLSKNYFFVRVEDFVKVFDREASKELDPENINTRMLVYEDRIHGWLFDVLEDVKDDPNAGFLVVKSLINHMESEQKFRGSTSSAIKRIFNTDAGPDFISSVRSNNPAKIRFDLHEKSALKRTESGFVVNPSKFLDAVRSDFDKYMGALKGSSKLRGDFNKSFRLSV